MKYRKKPVVIEAIQWKGDNLDAVMDFCDKCAVGENGICISTLEGDMYASKGDYIIKGVNGEFYPCKLDIFKKTYEAVE